MKKTNGFKIFICILISLNLTGCWSARELDTIAIVMGVGIDKPKELEQIEMTVQIVNPSKIKTGNKDSGEKSGGSKAFVNIKGIGDTVSKALMEINRKLNRDLFFSDNEIIVLGNSMAEEGIGKQLDFFLRNRETRMLVELMVAKGNSSEVLDIAPEIESINASNISDLLEIGKRHSEIVSVDLKEFSSKLMSKTTAPVLPLIGIDIKDGKQMVRIYETAVFKKDKMIGSLDKKETKGYLWIDNKIEKGFMEVSLKDSNGLISIETINSKTKINPEIIDGKIHMNIEIKEESELAEQLSIEDLAKPKKFEEIERAKTVEIEKEIMAAVKKAKELKADIFGFGEKVYKKYPKQWKSMEKNWDELFPEIEVSVKVDTKLRRNGRITKPIMSKDE
jgi:spore germination protein KC/spore germination protein